MSGSHPGGEAGLYYRLRRGEERAAEQIVQAHRGLVHSVSRRFFISSQERDDLLQAGNLGILRAARRFDPARGTSFTTYAVPFILEEMRRHLHGLGSASVSRRARDLVRRVREHQQRAAESGGHISLTNAAEELQVDAADIVFAGEAMRPAEPLEEETAPARDGLEPGNVEHLALRAAIGSLDARRRRIICRRYFSDRTQAQVAGELGLSQSQVSRLEKDALREIRDQIRSSPNEQCRPHDPPPYES